MRGKVIFGCLALIFRFSSSVNTGRKELDIEIAYGDTVDYSVIKRSYPFMARLILDSGRCGGALISDR